MKTIKESIDNLEFAISDKIVNIQEGEELGALELYHCLNKLQKSIKSLQDEVKTNAIIEIGNDVVLKGYDVKMKAGATRYIFKDIQAHKELTRQIKDFEAVSKQAYLSVTKGIQVASEDGEEIELPTVVRNADSISITLAK